MKFVSQLILNLLQQSFNYSSSFRFPRSHVKSTPHVPSVFCSWNSTLFFCKMESPYSWWLSEQMQSQAICRPQEESRTAPSVPSTISNCTSSWFQAFIKQIALQEKAETFDLSTNSKGSKVCTAPFPPPVPQEILENWLKNEEERCGGYTKLTEHNIQMKYQHNQSVS